MRNNNNNTIDGASVDDYIKEINTIPLLNAEEEIYLARRIKQGDEHAKNKFIAANLRLVVSIGRRYKNRGSFPDIIQNGNIGLIKAVNKFDPEKGFKFSTYAHNWIKREIELGLISEENTIKIPVHLFFTAAKIKTTTEKLSATMSREPTDSEIADKTGISETKIAHAKNVSQYTLSLDTKVNNEYENSTLGNTLEDKQNDPVKINERRTMQKNLKEALMSLNDREREIIIMRFDLDGKGIRTLSEIACMYGVHKERIRQIEANAIQKMRKPKYANKLKDFI